MRSRNKVVKRSAASMAAQQLTTQVFSNGNVTANNQQPADYLKSLLAPHKYKGMKIPDMATYPSVTFTEERTATYTPANVNGLLLVGLAPQAWIQTVAPIVASTAVELSAVSSLTLSSKYKAMRLVSAELQGVFTGRGEANQGTVVCGYKPFGWQHSRGSNGSSIQAVFNTGTTVVGASGTLPYVTANAFRGTFDTYSGPASEGFSVVYKPVDSAALNYQDVATVNVADTAQIVNANYTSDQGVITDGAHNSLGKKGWGSFYVAFDSCDASTAQFQFTICLNWEAIPLDEFSSIDIVTDSPTNISALSTAVSAISSISTGGSASAADTRTRLANSIISKYK